MSVKVKHLPSGKIYKTKVDAFKDFNPNTYPSVANKAKFFQQHKYDFQFLNEAFVAGHHNGKKVYPLNSPVALAAYTIETASFQFKITQSKNQIHHYSHIAPTIQPNETYKKIWGLENMNLIQECSDFYVLYDLTIDHSDDAFLMSVFKSKRDYLKKQFESYLDMAIGGELRHCKNFNTFFQDVPADTGFSWECDRHSAWAAWKSIRDNQGVEALNKAYDCYANGNWSSGYGGAKWANAVKVLLRHVKGEDTDTIFVDTVWSLQHNCTYILNKFWNVNGLVYVLDRKFKGDIKSLVAAHECSPEVEQLYKELNHVQL